MNDFKKRLVEVETILKKLDKMNMFIHLPSHHCQNLGQNHSYHNMAHYLQVLNRNEDMSSYNSPYIFLDNLFMLFKAMTPAFSLSNPSFNNF